MSAITSMYKALREEMQKHGAHLNEIPTPVLSDLTMIVGEFSADMRDELQRRANENSPEKDAA